MILSWISVALALLLPWLIASLWLRTLWIEAGPGVWPLAVGYGFMLAILSIASILHVMSLIGLNPSVWPVLVILLFIAWSLRSRFAALFLMRGHFKSKFKFEQTKWFRIIWFFLLAYLTLRFIVLAIDLVLKPIMPWDAWTTWIFRTKVWAETGQFVEFISPDNWLTEQDSVNRYALAAADYPPGVSLIALWPVLAYGRWSEIAASIPWLGCAIALGFGFYGQARMWGISSLYSLFGVYVLLSLPLLNTHVALPGYADLWLASALGLSAIAFFQWIKTGDKRQLVLWIPLALSSLMMKREAAVWVMLFVPAIVISRLSKRWQSFAILVCLFVLIIALFHANLSFDAPFLGHITFKTNLIELPWLGRFDLSYYNNWPAVWRHLFVYDNWHLFFYLLLLVLAVGFLYLFRSSSAPGWFKAQMAFVAGSLLLLYVLFFMTGAYLWAEKATSINRLILHFMPVYIFYVLTTWHLYKQSSSD